MSRASFVKYFASDMATLAPEANQKKGNLEREAFNSLKCC